MAKKNEVTKTDDKTTALAQSEDWGELAGQGFENLDSSDYTIPFINLLQDLSKQVKRGPDKIEGAEAGMFANSANGQVFNGEEGFYFVPVAIEKKVCEWVPRNEGGGFVAHHDAKSDIYLKAVERAKANKPVIASMGDVAASGGYYISMNSNRILAEPQTITGSIGVVGLVMNISDTLKWIGLNPQRITRGKRAAGYMTTRGLNEEDRKILRDNMQDLYGDFVAKVAVGRDKTPAEIHEVAQGRIWTGRAALAHGLVDSLGGLEDAIAQACRMSGIGERAKEGEDFHVLELPRRGGPFEALQDMFGARLGLDQLALNEFPELRRALSRLRALMGASRDRVCLVHPELTGLTRVFATPGR